MSFLLVALGLAVLMIVHEGGHHLVARAFRLRVTRFSIGFGPTIWKHRPRGSETTYQVAIIPFLAYVQIAGMNPFEDNDPNDEGSYANASLTARIATVSAGSLANYLFASVLFFIAFISLGKPSERSTVVDVLPGGAASAAQLQDGDKIIRIGDKEVADFEQMRSIILESAGKELNVGVLRDDQITHVSVTPRPEGKDGGGVIGVRPGRVPMGFKEAVAESLAKPALVVKKLLEDIGHMVTAREAPDVSGPVGIVKFGATMVDEGAYELLLFFGTLSAYLGGFNLLPVPALDGGRLMFLGYEAVARRKPNAKIEAQIHALGLLVFLALMAVVAIQDFKR
jgi:regulator of sigma E protease